MPLIATVTPNPAIDLSTSVDRVEPVRKLRCRSGQRDPGGGGINVARVVQRLGGDAVAVYPVGGLAGGLLQELVTREGLRSVVTPVAGETRENLTVLDEHSDAQYRFVLPGPHLRGVEWMACLKTLAGLPQAPAFVCASGSLPPGAPDDFYARVAEIASGWGARLVLDTSGPALRAALDSHIHLIKPNLNEMRELSGSALDDEASLARACHELVTRTRVEAVALTLGAQGALLVTAGQAWRAAPLKVEALSGVGAGDSFLGALVWAWAAGKTLDEAFRYGMAGGAAAILAPGTELSRSADIHRLVSEVKVERVDLHQAAA